MENTAILQNQLLVVAEDESKEISTADGKSDAYLVNLVLAKEEQAAFEEIFNRHKKSVTIVARRYFREPQKIEEIVQISFTKAYFELKNFRGENEFSLASWLGKIAINTCLDAIKKNKRKPEDLLCEFTETESEIIFARLTSADNAENKLIKRDLAEKLLSQLPLADRALLQMLFVEEMSVSEIADLTGKSRANIKVRSFRARAALKKILRKFL
jgi:RNA polymerase sigma-70 factor, ECF subfamily